MRSGIERLSNADIAKIVAATLVYAAMAALVVLSMLGWI